MKPMLDRKSMTIEDLIRQALTEGASDLHLRSRSNSRIRIDGELYRLDGVVYQEHEIREFMFNMLTKQQIEEFEDTYELDFSCHFSNICRMRVNMFMQQGQLCSSLRLIPNQIPTLEELDLPKVIYHFLQLNKGLVVVTGPTGCGKSTTLAAMLNYINSTRRCHILTIEDPVEFVYEEKMATVSQREVGLDTKGFDEALTRSFRQDPDVVLLGEMRDYETMKAAITLAETGHLTFSTLHTGEASETINRIINSFPPHQQSQIRMQLMISLEGIVSQVLLPLKEGGGRVAAREILVVNRAVRNLIREGKTHHIYSAIQTGQDQGMITINQSLGLLYERGLVTYEAAYTASWRKREFQEKYSK